MAARAIVPAALLGTLLLAPLASAHATAYNTGDAAAYQVKFLYGNLDEPAATYQKTGLDLGLFDAKGNPLAGLEAVDDAGTAVASPPIHVSLSYADQVLDLTPSLRAQAGRPGWYTAPIIYTRPGAYVLHVAGTINGTTVAQAIQPARPVADSTGQMFPARVDTPNATAAKIAQLTNANSALKDELATLKARVASLEGASSRGAPGVDGGLLLVGFLAILGLAAARRA